MTDRFDGRSYQARINALAKSGVEMHGEAILVCSFGPKSVLDAGCGTGRVAIELARRGVDVVGVDISASMIAEARRSAPHLEWIEADLAELELHRNFDVVLLAGNVPLYCDDERRPALIASSSDHVATGGRLIAGFQLHRGYDLDDFDRESERAGLVLRERWSTWDREPFVSGGDYAVSVLVR